MVSGKEESVLMLMGPNDARTVVPERASAL